MSDYANKPRELWQADDYAEFVKDQVENIIQQVENSPDVMWGGVAVKITQDSDPNVEIFMERGTKQLSDGRTVPMPREGVMR